MKARERFLRLENYRTWEAEKFWGWLVRKLKREEQVQRTRGMVRDIVNEWWAKERANRRVLTDAEMRNMDCPYPPEPEWGEEWERKA